MQEMGQPGAGDRRRLSLCNRATSRFQIANPRFFAFIHQPDPIGIGLSGSKAQAPWLLSLLTKRRVVMQTSRMCRVVCAVAVLAFGGRFGADR
jgi:hypothetical protein